eukprot:s194_g37.t1
MNRVTKEEFIACFCGSPLLAESLRRLSSGDSLLHRRSSSPLQAWLPTLAEFVRQALLPKLSEFGPRPQEPCDMFGHDICKCKDGVVMRWEEDPNSEIIRRLPAGEKLEILKPGTYPTGALNPCTRNNGALEWLKSEFGSGAPRLGLPTWVLTGLTREATASLEAASYVGLDLVESFFDLGPQKLPLLGCCHLPEGSFGNFLDKGITVISGSRPSGLTALAFLQGLCDQALLGYILVFEATIQIFEIYCLATIQIFEIYCLVFETAFLVPWWNYIRVFEALTVGILTHSLIYLAVAWNYFLIYHLVIQLAKGEVMMSSAPTGAGTIPLQEFRRNIPPGWQPGDASYPLRLYFDKLKLGYRICNLDDEIIGPLVAGRLYGRAAKVALSLRVPRPDGSFDSGDAALARLSVDEVRDMQTGAVIQNHIPSGVQFLTSALKAAFGQQDQDLATQALERFFNISRSRMTLAEYSVEFESRLDEASDRAGLQLNDGHTITYTGEILGGEGSLCPALVGNPALRRMSSVIFTNFFENGDGLLTVDMEPDQNKSKDTMKIRLFRLLLTDSGRYLLPTDETSKTKMPDGTKSEVTAFFNKENKEIKDEKNAIAAAVSPQGILPKDVQLEHHVHYDAKEFNRPCGDACEKGAQQLDATADNFHSFEDEFRKYSGDILPPNMDQAKLNKRFKAVPEEFYSIDL